ncbi:zinc finger CCCH-type antiviral protein 1-like [Penaeus japonicus]|uniref:zinc finger CCCH-type antiviral protein 1-like n=1 Tax=Penaeus japonicus TaxID=27405 RepID=UPI001C714673|nr:zinc finger CCCH-type antiviral protein 1-like [Penaeus japonicus]
MEEAQVANSSENDGCSAVKQMMLILSRYPDFEASLLELFEKHNLPPSEVRGIVSENPSCFVLESEIVRARLQLVICPFHCGVGGCQKLGSCNKLHICPRYVHDLCSERQCFLGHKWRTDHNSIVFAHTRIETLPVAIIHMLMRSATRPPLLRICQKYNDKQCKNSHCDELHICATSVLGEGRRPHTKCHLNHSLNTPACRFLLRMHGLSTNDSIKDVIASSTDVNSALYTESKPTIPLRSGKLKEKENLPSTPSRKNGVTKIAKIASPGDANDTSPGDSAQGHAEQASNTLPDKLKGKAENPHQEDKNKKETLETEAKILSYQTCWSIDVLGNVDIQEICFDSVDGFCAKERTGCPRLHAPHHFHWQISDLVSSQWYNFPVLQTTCLETSFCDPAQDGVTLPRLDPSSQSPPINDLLLLLGRDIWKADFQKLELTSSLQSKKLRLRRLCTEPVANQDIPASNYIWYFLDDNNLWIPYGHGTEKSYAGNLSSKIESHFSQKVHQKIRVKIKHHTYILDFHSMTQTNQETNKVRAVRRRPGKHLVEEKQTSLFPLTWTPMLPETQMVKVLLSPLSSECHKVTTLINRSLVTEGLKIVRIRRIQNPQLWRSFQATKNSLKKDSSASSVDDLQVFKEVRSSHKDSICLNNFEWKVHQATKETKYGQGVCFYTNPSLACKNFEGRRASFNYLFVVRALVASKIKGPILQPQLKRYDTIVDSRSNPTIIVKCDKSHYYPEYLVTMKSVV